MWRSTYIFSWKQYFQKTLIKKCFVLIYLNHDALLTQKMVYIIYLHTWLRLIYTKICILITYIYLKIWKDNISPFHFVVQDFTKSLNLIPSHSLQQDIDIPVFADLVQSICNAISYTQKGLWSVSGGQKNYELCLI